MPKYKLRLVPPGDYLYCEGEMVYVGNSAAEAHAFYVEEAYEEGPEFWVHPEILRGRVTYARNIEAGDCHEDAEPGDTTYDLITGHPERALRELGDNEVLSWPRGAWRPHWSYRPPCAANGPKFVAEVAGQEIGEFGSRDETEAAVNAKVAELVDAWKAAHPEYRCVVPEGEG